MRVIALHRLYQRTCKKCGYHWTVTRAQAQLTVRQPYPRMRVRPATREALVEAQVEQVEQFRECAKCGGVRFPNARSRSGVQPTHQWSEPDLAESSECPVAGRVLGIRNHRPAVHGLLQFLPVLPAEQSSESSREGRSLVMRGVRMQHEGTFGRRQVGRFLVRQGTTD